MYVSTLHTCSKSERPLLESGWDGLQDEVLLLLSVRLLAARGRGCHWFAANIPAVRRGADSGTGTDVDVVVLLQQKTSFAKCQSTHQFSPFPFNLFTQLPPPLPPPPSPPHTPDLPSTGARSADPRLHVEPRPHVLWLLLSPHQLSIGIAVQFLLHQVKWEWGYL